MLKKILCILIISVGFILSAHTGEFDNVINNNENVFLYLYTKNCSYCIKFNPIYNKIAKKYSNNYKFIKIDADSAYGSSLMRDIQAHYVPYVVIFNHSKQVVKSIEPICLLSYACTQYELEKFVR